ncbi:hypothetical protein GVAV_001454 [Gurleya vavrai]
MSLSRLDDLKSDALLQNKMINIKFNLNKNTKIDESLCNLICILPQINEKEASIFIDIMQKLYLISKNPKIIDTWIKIIKFYESKSMFDVFFDFFWINRNDYIAEKIKDLFIIFNDYFYKYMRELESIETFEEIVICLKKRCKDALIKFSQKNLDNVI